MYRVYVDGKYDSTIDYIAPNSLLTQKVRYINAHIVVRTGNCSDVNYIYSGVHVTNFYFVGATIIQEDNYDENSGESYWDYLERKING